MTSWWRKIKVGVIACCPAAVLTACGIFTPTALQSQARATITINPHQHGPTLTRIALGMNVAEWDSHLYSPTVVSRLQDLGVGVLRWPGGSYADVWDWETNPKALAQFGELVDRLHIQGIVTVNYGTGTAQQAAAEVHFANILHHYGIEYWEIGNEQYGAGAYPGAWEANDLANKGPRAYAHRVVQFVRSMRKVDPYIKIGVDATIPGIWPSGFFQRWDRTMLPIVAPYINFIAVHWYPENPGQENNAALLTDPARIPKYMARLRQYLAPYVHRIKIFTEETNNVSSSPDNQTISLVNALFLVEDYNGWLEQGAQNVSWWDLHNSPNSASPLKGPGLTIKGYGDYGILSAGSTGEPALNTPFAPYYGYLLMHRFVTPGAKYVTATSNQAALVVYAVRWPNREIHVMVINSSPTRTYQVTVIGLRSLTGKMGTFYEYSLQHPTLQTAQRSWTNTLTVAPYSITVVDAE
ncbi:MAG: hypothetical protein C7B46_15170 [Sulfobacillus benefaciens]|uniref:Alpha-L-arabinofuranosidase n=1 Tax=Sulfobacillus benefaciens TaxID=453960 RepID=A0A2T2XCR2_9FIRM|nr:MAG: hypothetical protein C7B46_15170 [Sulfobacillus benefaciens]